MNMNDANSMLGDSVRVLQFGSGSSAGAVLLGSGNSTSRNSTNTAGFGEIEGTTVLFYIVGAIIGIFCVACTSYILVFLYDRLFCCGPRYDDETFANMDRGPVARKAGLWGLTKEERSMLLKHVFSSTTHPWDEPRLKAASTAEDEDPQPHGKADAEKPDNEQNEKVEEVETATPVQEEEESVKDGREQQQATPDDEETDESNIPAARPESAKNKLDILDDADHERLCCICLNEYVAGCRVMTGTTCNHLLHASCAMEWLQSNHDHCPYCRVEMMTPTEYRDAASVILGAARVAGFGNHVPVRRTTAAMPDERDVEAGLVSRGSEATDVDSPSTHDGEAEPEPVCFSSDVTQEIEMTAVAEEKEPTGVDSDKPVEGNDLAIDEENPVSVESSGKEKLNED